MRLYLNEAFAQCNAISIVLIVFGLALMVQGWFPKEKEMITNKLLPDTALSE